MTAAFIVVVNGLFEVVETTTGDLADLTFRALFCFSCVVAVHFRLRLEGRLRRKLSMSRSGSGKESA